MVAGKGKKTARQGPVVVEKVKRELGVLLGWVWGVHLLCWQRVRLALLLMQVAHRHLASPEVCRKSLMFVAFQKALHTHALHDLHTPHTGFSRSSSSSRMERFFGSFVPTTREVRFDCLPLPPSPLSPFSHPHPLPLPLPHTVRDI